MIDHYLMLDSQPILQAEGLQAQVSAHVVIDLPQLATHSVQLEFEGKLSHSWLFSGLNENCADRTAAVMRKKANIGLLYILILVYPSKNDTTINSKNTSSMVALQGYVLASQTCLKRFRREKARISGLK